MKTALVSTLAGMASVASASHAPFMSWSTSSAAPSAASAAEVLSGEGFSRAEALSRVRSLRESVSSATSGRRRALHFMLVDELHTEELTSLASSADPAVTGALQSISADIVRGGAGTKDALVVSRAELHGDEGLPRLREQITAELEGCTITEVVSTVAQTAGEAAVHEGAITRQQYEDILRATNLEAPAAPECQAFIVPLAKAALPQELQFLAQANRLAAKATATGGVSAPEHVFVFTSEAAREPSYVAEDAAAEKAAGEAIVQATGAKARMLQQQQPSTAVVYGNIAMQPEIITGLIVGGFLLFVVWVGISCTMSVRGPDILHSTTLPAGKEY